MKKKEQPFKMYFESNDETILTREKPRVFEKWLYKRIIYNNKNAIIIFNGDTGSGKSYACLRLAQDAAKMFETRFSIEKNVAFQFDDLLKKTKLPENTKKGTVFIMEEVGAFGSGASSREWQSKANKFFFSYLQTARSKNQVLILNCPSFSYLEKGARGLVNFQFEAKGVNTKKKISKFMGFSLQVNRRTGKIYFKFLRYVDRGVKRKARFKEFTLPDPKLLKEYEIEKKKFTDAHDQKIIDDANKPKKKVYDEKRGRRKENCFALLDAGKRVEEIADILDCSTPLVYVYRQLYKNIKKEQTDREIATNSI